MDGSGVDDSDVDGAGVDGAGVDDSDADGAGREGVSGLVGEDPEEDPRS